MASFDDSGILKSYSSEILKKYDFSILDKIEKGNKTAPLSISRRELRQQKKTLKQETAGPSWFNLPATPLTPELKLDLKILQLRGYIDPKKHYKRSHEKELPKYFHVGRVLDNPADFYSSRLTKKERKNHFVDELLANQALRQYAKRKALEIQRKKEAGGKKHYRKHREKRHKHFK